MRVRGHHLACTYCYLGSRKTSAREFFGVDNAIPELLAMLRAEPAVELVLVDGPDDVCDVCSLKVPEGCGRGASAAGGAGAQNDKLAAWDRAILGRLGLSPGHTCSARRVEELLRKRIPDIGVVCGTCSSAAPTGWQGYRRAIAQGLWKEEVR